MTFSTMDFINRKPLFKKIFGFAPNTRYAT